MSPRVEPLSPTVAAVLLAVSALMCWSSQMPAGLRIPLVVGYLLLAPGYALVPALGRGHRLLHFLLALCTGASIAILLSTAMSFSGYWRVDAAVVGTWLLVVAAVTWRAWRSRASLLPVAGR